MSQYWHLFVELIVTPFGKLEMIWGIVPLYFGWLLNELTPGKANYRTALQTGFSFTWAALQWLYPHFIGPGAWSKMDAAKLLSVNMTVSFVVLGIGIIAFLSGLFHKFPPFGKFLGHTRFGNYFMIAIYPMQANHLKWSWDYLLAIIIFAFPIWIILQFGLKPLRK